MIIRNGTIEMKLKTGGGGIDPATGHPVHAASEWSDSVPCQYNIVRHDYLAKSNGEPYRAASYEILVEGTSFDHEQLRLTDMRGNKLGEFSVISVSEIQAVEQVKIIV